MLAIHARFRGRNARRADYVARSMAALSRVPEVRPFERVGTEDIRAEVNTPAALCNVALALLSDAAWALGIAVTDADHSARGEATDALGAATRPGVVRARVIPDPTGQAGENIAAAFLLLGQVLAKRSLEGRQATALMRAGMTQNEAAAELGITKQAMSQRLFAAGWAAENAGCQLAENLITASWSLE